MSYCPSHDWDRYLALNEPAEECPQCGEPNFDEDTGAPVFPGEPDFCSQKCADEWTAAEKAASEAESKWADFWEASSAAFDAAIATDHFPFCACGRRLSECDGSRKGCAKTPESRSQAEQGESGPETRNETREPSEEPSEPTCSGCGGSGVDPDPGPNNHGCPPACPRCEGCGDEQACLDRLFGPGSP